MRKACLLVMALAFTLQYPLAQDQDFSKVEMKVTKVNGNVYMPEMKSGKGQYFRGDELPSVLKAQLEPIKAQ